MTKELIVKNTFKKFHSSVALAIIALALMSLVNIFVASVNFGTNGEYTMGIALPVVIFAEIIVYFFGVGGGIAASVRQGEGEAKRAEGIFSLSLVCTLIIGLITACAGNIFLEEIMRFLGAVSKAEQELISPYLRVYFIGMPFYLLVGVMTVFIRNDNNPRFAMAGVMVSVGINLILLYVFIGIMELGIFSVALAGVISNAVCVIIYVIYFVGKNSTIKLSRKISISNLADIFAPGFSGSMIFLAQTLLTVVINRVLLDINGADAIAIYAVVKYAITFIYSIYDSVNHSAQPMFSVYFGERDNVSITQTAKIATKYIVTGAVLLCLAHIIAAKFFLWGRLSNAIFIIGISCLFSWAPAFLNSFYRSTGKAMLSLLYIVLDNLIFPAVFMYIFVYIMKIGLNGVWFSIMCSEIVTILLMILLSRGNLLYTKKGDDEDKIYETLILNSEVSIVNINSEIEEFCEKNGIGPKKQYYIFLCIEEIAVNIIKHGFKDGKEHYIDIKLALTGDDVLLNIRDDAIGFDPTKKVDADVTLPAEERDIGGLGIYLVKKISKEFSYKRVIGFNNLHIVL